MLLLRDLAAGEPAAFEKLCDLFDARTQDGSDFDLVTWLVIMSTEYVKNSVLV